jgi:hypothetical protein
MRPIPVSRTNFEIMVPVPQTSFGATALPLVFEKMKKITHQPHFRAAAVLFNEYKPAAVGGPAEMVDA